MALVERWEGEAGRQMFCGRGDGGRGGVEVHCCGRGGRGGRVEDEKGCGGAEGVEGVEGVEEYLGRGKRDNLRAFSYRNITFNVLVPVFFDDVLIYFGNLFYRCFI